MPQHEQERRSFAAGTMAVETRDGVKGVVLRGHAAVFDTLSENMGGWYERIARGAFDDAIRTDDVRALLNHDSNFILGRTKSGTLSLSTDERGLAVEIQLPDTSTIADLVVEPIRRGDISQMSFAFRVKAGGQKWDEDDEGRTIRTVTAVKLFDVSPVTYPAYAETDVAVRAMSEWRSSNTRKMSDAGLRLMAARRRELDALM
jgi:hypothetical protein